ncbi:MAG: ion channel [Pseudomonadota bacterium]
MLAISLVNAAIIALVVIIHYEFLFQFTMLMPRLRIRHRFRIVVGVLAALTAHVIEVCIFGFSYFLMDRGEAWGSLRGNYESDLGGSIYFSFTAYTTLGLGDIEPIGPLRFLVGLESLVGFVLITWTASFLYLEMTRNWDSP